MQSYEFLFNWHTIKGYFLLRIKKQDKREHSENKFVYLSFILLMIFI